MIGQLKKYHYCCVTPTISYVYAFLIFNIFFFWVILTREAKWEQEEIAAFQADENLGKFFLDQDSKLDVKILTSVESLSVLLF